MVAVRVGTGAAMTAVATAASGDAAAGAPVRKGGKKKLIILLAVPSLLAGVGAGLWFGGILPPLLGMDGAPAAEGAAAPEKGGHGTAAGHGKAPANGANASSEGHGAGPGTGKDAGKPAAFFMDLPEIIANLNAGPRRNSFIKLRPKIELARAEDEPAVRAAMPRLLDLFQTYLREMRPEELRGSAGTYRLREELIARANIAVAPARVVDVLFPEIIVQ